MTGPYAIKWGFCGGGPEGWATERREDHLDEALAVAAANGGTVFDSRGHQLTKEDIAAHQHPYRRAAEEIVGTLMLGVNDQIGERLEIQTYNCFRLGSWTVESAVVAVERCLEGSGL